jgi:hypothetical protein
MAKTCRCVNIKVGMVNRVQTPKHMNVVAQSMQKVGKSIEQENP